MIRLLLLAMGKRRSLLLPVALVLALPAAAAPPPPDTTRAPAPVAPRRPVAPVPYNSAVRSARLPADPAKVEVETRADGIRVFHLNGQGMQTVTARIGADGRLQLRCNDRAEHALQTTTGESRHDPRAPLR
ncbi:MAG TPA: hypothetical protein VFG73_07325 [Rhodanobacteraceae bacterium]|nr:hypothetical protein [Rhodanobacteraceae bacterium]